MMQPDLQRMLVPIKTQSTEPPALPLEEMSMDNLYENIETLCNQRGIRPGRLCNELGISRGLITDLKMGRKKGVNAETAQKIASFFGISVGQLLGQQDSSDVLDQADVAFYGDFKELNDDEKEAVRDMVRVMRERRAAKRD